MNNNNKKRVLFVGEASYIATGFGTYYSEVLKRLYGTGQIEIAEIGSYAHDDDQRRFQVPWRFYPVGPDRNNPKAVEAYKRNYNTNQFGEWRFDDVCLDFKPDVVVMIRDFWMDEFVLRSPYRKYFKIIWMPTIDGIPQRDLWLDSYKLCDGILTYSDWGMDVLKKDGRPGTNLITTGSPGVDLDVFKPPEDKKAHKKKMGFDPDTIVVGMTARNQKRKLYYDLIEAFSQWVYINKTKGHLERVNKTFLYLHTSYPDVGYNIVKATQEFKIGHKVILTYICSSCKTVYPSFFCGEIAKCRKCGKVSAHPPNANSHCPRNVLADIIKCFDLYVQYSICLGKDEEILTNRGWTKISEIQKGDSVLTHKNRYKKVLNKLISPNKGNVKEISIHSDYEKLSITDNHPCYAITKDVLHTKNKGSVRAILGTKIRENRNIPNPEFVKVENLQPGDMLALAIDDSIVDVDRIDLKEFAKEEDVILDNYIEVKNGDSYPRYITVDEEFCEFLGLYVTDGHSNKSTGEIQITYNINEKYNENLGKNIWGKLTDKKASIVTYKDRKASDTKMCSRLHRDLFNKWCSRHENKQLPDWCLKLPNNKTKAILKGMLTGDGCIQKDRKTSIYTTISKKLSNQLKFLLRRNRINFNCRIDKKVWNKDNRNRKHQYRFEIPATEFKYNFMCNKRSNTCHLYLENFHLLKIKSIKNANYKDQYVYNLEVEDDHSYNSKISVLHNCEGYSMPVPEAMACGVPTAAVNYSAMEDHLRCPTSITIDVERFFYEPIVETEQKRALPNNRDFVRKMDRFIKFNDQKRKELSDQTRQYATELVDVYGQEEKLPRFSWDRTASIWNNFLKEYDTSKNKSWDAQLELINLKSLQIPYELNNSKFVRWCLINLIQRPDFVGTQYEYDWTQKLNTGQAQEGDKYIQFDKEKLVQIFTHIAQRYNHFEQKRSNQMVETSNNETDDIIHTEII